MLLAAQHPRTFCQPSTSGKAPPIHTSDVQSPSSPLPIKPAALFSYAEASFPMAKATSRKRQRIKPCHIRLWRQAGENSQQKSQGHVKALVSQHSASDFLYVCSPLPSTAHPCARADTHRL